MENQDINNQQNKTSTQPAQPAAPVLPVTPVSQVATSVSEPNLAAQGPTVNNGKKGMNKVLLTGIVVFAAAVIIGGLFAYKSGLFRGGSNLNAQPATSMTSPQNPTPVATPTPVTINNQQDLQNALNTVNNTDPSSMTSTLNQNSADASQFGQ